jgi:hypothetical protein
VMGGAIALLTVLLVVIVEAVSMDIMAGILAVIPIMMIMCAGYFGCARPLWLWSDAFRVAHFLWIEEVGEGVGVYRTNWVGEMRHSAFKKMEPWLRDVKLV